MANYVPNFTKAPAELLIALLNRDNDFTFGVEDYSVKDMDVLETPSEKGNDTVVLVDLLKIPSEVVGDYWEFFYKRMPLGEVFSEVTAEGLNVFRQVDIELDENGFPVDLDAFRAEILRKYGFNVTAEDYDITLVSAGAGTGALKVAAKASNLAYTGEFTMGVVDSLAARVAKVDLEGFSKDSLDLPEPELVD